jgi:hypothetical protein
MRLHCVRELRRAARRGDRIRRQHEHKLVRRTDSSLHLREPVRRRQDVFEIDPDVLAAIEQRVRERGHECAVGSGIRDGGITRAIRTAPRLRGSISRTSFGISHSLDQFKRTSPTRKRNLRAASHQPHPAGAHGDPGFAAVLWVPRVRDTAWAGTGRAPRLERQGPPRSGEYAAGMDRRVDEVLPELQRHDQAAAAVSRAPAGAERPRVAPSRNRRPPSRGAELDGGRGRGLCHCVWRDIRREEQVPARRGVVLPSPG